MKILIVHQGKLWKSYPNKIKELQEWFKPLDTLDVTVVPVSFKKIPFKKESAKKSPIDPVWYSKNITPLAKGYDAVIFTVPMKQWKGNDLRGRITYKTPYEIQLGSNEKGSYTYNKIKYPGDRFFNIARHELTHAFYHKFKTKDSTHYWWELGKIENTIKELKGKANVISHLDIAISQLGVKETLGSGNNPVIMNWAKEIGIPYVSDETAWCSLFINWVCFKAKLPHTKKLNARSWLDVGTKVTSPKMGDIVVFWRVHKDSWQGHVGIWINENTKNIFVLGGNQGDSVSFAEYSKSQLLGYRRLTNS